MRHLQFQTRDSEWVLFKKRDIYLYLLIIFIVVAAVYLSFDSSTGSTIVVRIDGENRYRFTLEEDSIHTIERNGKKMMDLMIDQSDVRVINSQCPRHFCERGTLKQSGVLVCVPQKVIIIFEDEEEPVKDNDGIDMITG
ncbi:MAG: NusG domain II-containing protein [Thermotogota bacterium]